MKMRASWVAIFRRELGAYFNSPIAYIFLFVFGALLGSLFMASFFLASFADMRGFFGILPLALCVFLPAVTMRLWAEERKGHTDELLLTFPIRPQDLVLGKFLAALFFSVAALASTAPIPVMLALIGTPDLGQIASGYAGAVLMGAFFLAVGIFISGLCRDQIVAFIVSMLSCLTMVLLGTEFIAASIDGWLPGLGTVLRNAVGMTRHFASFEKGVVDARDALYFLIGTALFLVLNGFWIEGRMRPKQTRIFVAASAMAAAIFVLGNRLIGDLALGRFDLTEGRLYTVSPVSKKMLAGLKAPVTVKYYVSPQDKMPSQLKLLEQDVLSKLDEFRLASNGKLQVKVFRMEAANLGPGAGKESGDKESLETSLQRKGIQPFQAQSVEADEVGVRLIYSAMAIAYKEKPEEILPAVIPNNLDQLEYLLLSKIYRLTLPRAPAVALVAPYQDTPIDPNMRALLEQLGRQVPETQVKDNYRLAQLALRHEGYEVARVGLTEQEPIPSGAATLVILEPDQLTDDQRFMINRFVVEGGSVFLAVQPYEFQYTPSGRGEIAASRVAKSPQVAPLLEAWGLGVEERVLQDENQEMVNLAGGFAVGPFQVSVPVKLPIHIRVDPRGMSQELSITSRLNPILYLWGSAVKLDQQKLESLGLTTRVLMRSSPESWLSGTAGLVSPAGRSSAESRGPFPLAVLVEGQFPNAFEQSRPTVTLTPAPGKLLLIGAVTPFQDQMIERGGHLDLFLNSVGALSLGEDLVTIRAKQPVDRSIGRISAAAKAWWRFFVSLLVPLLIAGAGWARILWRRRAKTQYLRFVKAATA